MRRDGDARRSERRIATLLLQRVVEVDLRRADGITRGTEKKVWIASEAERNERSRAEHNLAGRKSRIGSSSNTRTFTRLCVSNGTSFHARALLPTLLVRKHDASGVYLCSSRALFASTTREMGSFAALSLPLIDPSVSFPFEPGEISDQTGRSSGSKGNAFPNQLGSHRDARMAWTMATMRVDATSHTSFVSRPRARKEHVRCRRLSSRRCASASASSERPIHQRRLIQHKQEAYWFYRFLSIVYDHIVNPGHWTEDMRKEALEPAKLDQRDLKVYDVGGGTGFCTLGIVEHVDGKHVTLLDQSPHQLAKAKAKPALEQVTIVEGDAEDLPFENDSADRYVSAGSIEYWPEPQRGICEAYRVLKPGGLACLIGPVHPTHPVSRFFADAWMLFPSEEEYMDWFTKAGFENVQIKHIGPKWYRGVRRHGLIMGCSVTGVKPNPGPSPLDLGPKMESRQAKLSPMVFLPRLLLGTAAGFYYFVLPIYMFLKHVVISGLEKVYPKAASWM